MRPTSLLWLALPGFVVLACGGAVSLGNTGGGLGADDGGTGGGSDASIDCSTKDACGPPPGMPATTCPDGSIGGNTGRCVAKGATCGWEIRECPAPLACFDDAGQLDPFFKTCTDVADCVVVPYPKDCCGTIRAAGVNRTKEALVKDCATKRAASLPACGCPTMPTVADDGSSESTGFTAVAACSNGRCESTFKRTTCGTKTCSPTQTCCEGIPLPEPTCVEGDVCPVSRREYKKDIRYLSEEDRERLRSELLRIPLATYRYKTEGAADREHLGFIIDDIAPSAAVTANGERVDMYGYQTMAVATLQAQERELAELRREVAAVRRDLARVRGIATDRDRESVSRDRTPAGRP
jgi:hypothetical protein